MPPSSRHDDLGRARCVKAKPLRGRFASLHGGHGRRDGGGLSLGRPVRRAPGHTPHVTRLRSAHMAGRRDPGSAIFFSSRLSSSRPPRLGQPSEPSLRDGFASPDPASAHQEIGPCDEDGEIRRRWAGRRWCSGPAGNSGQRETTSPPPRWRIRNLVAAMTGRSW